MKCSSSPRPSPPPTFLQAPSVRVALEKAEDRFARFPTFPVLSSSLSFCRAPKQRTVAPTELGGVRGRSIFENKLRTESFRSNSASRMVKCWSKTRFVRSERSHRAVSPTRCRRGKKRTVSSLQRERKGSVNSTGKRRAERTNQLCCSLDRCSLHGPRGLVSKAIGERVVAPF